jgi:hypothetical protein
LRPTPLSPDFDPLASSRSSTPRHLVSAARYIRAAPKNGARFRGLLGCVGPKAYATFAVSLRPNDPKTILASPAPPEWSEDHSCFAAALAGSSENSPSAARSALIARRRFQHHDLLHPDHPKATRISRRSTSLIRRSTKLSGSVVGAGRDHPKSLSIPGRRRPHKASMPKHLLLASLPRLLPASPFDGRPQRLSAATHDRFARRRVDRVAGHQCASSDRLACALQTGLSGG